MLDILFYCESCNFFEVVIEKLRFCEVYFELLFLNF